MRREIIRHQKYKALQRILSDYPQAFEGKPEAQALVDTLAIQNDQLSETISKLIRPVSTVYRPKQDTRKTLLLMLNSMLGVSIMIATRIGNQPLIDIMKLYRRQLPSAPAYNVYEMAVHVSAEIGKEQELAANLGVTAEKLSDFNKLIAAFGSIIDDTGLALNDRKVERRQLNALLKACNILLRDQIDHFVIANKTEYPDLHLTYTAMRGPRRPRRSNNQNNPGLSDISGTVTDNTTNLPVANAYIGIIQQGSVTETDADGSYLIDELNEGDYTVSCHAPGYEVPEPVQLKAGVNDSLVVDFNLKPVDPLLN